MYVRVRAYVRERPLACSGGILARRVAGARAYRASRVRERDRGTNYIGMEARDFLHLPRLFSSRSLLSPLRYVIALESFESYDPFWHSYR